jgi:hypothetical protein
MTIYRKRLLIVFLTVLVANMFVFAASGTTMAGETTSSAMKSMNVNNCDDCEPGNDSCDICVVGCVTPLARFIDNSSIFVISASTQYKIENRHQYISHISLLDPFPPRPLYLA